VTDARRRCLNGQRCGPAGSPPGADDRAHPVNPGPGRHPGEVLYDTTKGAVHMFARAIAVEFRDRNIRCTAVCPGFIETPHGLREVADLQALGVDVSEAAIATAQGRIGKPMEVAQAALFLASDEASFVNGTHLFVDNGFTAA
jgi:NAD(P)-dependent dehydrogenase (short-subunit alcohol dehydrogenase family)